MAIALAEEALEVGEVPVGCVYVKDGQVVARARNRTNELKNATKHAEIVAYEEMLAATSDPSGVIATLRGATLYVTVEPCVMCAAALRVIGVAHIVFGCGNARFGGCGSVLPVNADLFDGPFGPPIPVTSGVRADVAVRLLQHFYARENPAAPQPRKKTGREEKLGPYQPFSTVVGSTLGGPDPGEDPQSCK